MTWLGGRDVCYAVSVKLVAAGQMEHWAWLTCQKHLRAQQLMEGVSLNLNPMPSTTSRKKRKRKKR
jgi:hypothetical protein